MSGFDRWRYQVAVETPDGSRVIIHASDNVYDDEATARRDAGRMLGHFIEQDDNGRVSDYVDLRAVRYFAYLGHITWQEADDITPIDPDSYDEDEDE